MENTDPAPPHPHGVHLALPPPPTLSLPGKMGGWPLLKAFLLTLWTALFVVACFGFRVMSDRVLKPGWIFNYLHANYLLVVNDLQIDIRELHLLHCRWVADSNIFIHFDWTETCIHTFVIFPAAQIWLSFSIIIDDKSYRCVSIPATKRAYFSTSLKPGVVFLVPYKAETRNKNAYQHCVAPIYEWH